MLGAALLAGATMVPDPAAAYCLAGIENYYSSSESRLSTNIPTGWYTALDNAAHAWNGHANWWMDTVPPDFIGPVRGTTSMLDFSANGLPDAPGWTLPYWHSNGWQIYGGDVVLNSDWTWYTNGTMNQTNHWADVRTIATHEYGHLIHLSHPGDCGSMTTAETNAVMNPQYVQKWSINSDDIAGLVAVMGP